MSLGGGISTAASQYREAVTPSEASSTAAIGRTPTFASDRTDA